MSDLQDDLLRGIVARAAARVPIVKYRLHAAGLAPDDMATVADLRDLPPITKADLLEAGTDALVDPTVPSASGMTSGSSGEAMALRYERTWWARSQAARAFVYQRLGVGGGRMVDIMVKTPRQLAPGARDRAFPVFDRRVVPFGLPIDQQVDLVERLSPRVLYANRSSHLLHAEELERRGRRLAGLGFAMSTGEVLTPADRVRIEEAYGAPLHDMYGQSEFSMVCWQDVPGGTYRTMAPRVVVEVLVDGRPAQPGETGELVLTSLDNPAMPLLRYASGDVARLDPTSPPSGHPGIRLSQIGGRMVDILRRTDGVAVHPGSAMYGEVWRSPELLAVVRRHQLEQVSLDLVRVHLVCTGPLPCRVRDEIRHHVRALLGPLQVQILEADDIPLSARGKYKQVVSRL